jgi:putative endonuclease
MKIELVILRSCLDFYSGITERHPERSRRATRSASIADCREPVFHPDMIQPCVYILRCSDGSYYTGCTSNLSQRLEEHSSAIYRGYTSCRLPVYLVFSQEFFSMDEAIAAERQIKGWSRKKKEALINGRYDLLRELSQCRNETHARNNA